MQYVEKTYLADHGMKMPSYCISKKEYMMNRQLWDSMKDMGVEIMCGEPDPEYLGKVEEFCMEYDIKLAIHNHPQGHSIYWNPDTSLSLIPFIDIFDSLNAWKWQGIITIELETIPASLQSINLCARYI